MSAEYDDIESAATRNDTKAPSQAGRRSRPVVPEPSEHTALLTPDDPSVSPYNVFAVRAVKLATIFLLFITSFLVFLLLLSDFVYIPFLNSPGKGFNELSYAITAVLSLTTSLVYFSIPSAAERLVASISLGLLATILIITLAIAKLRHSSGLLGVVLQIWLFLVVALSIIGDRIVEKAKYYEEERLTGRIETRRTCLEWVEVSSRLFLRIILLLVLFLFTFATFLRWYDSRIDPPGVLVPVQQGTFNIHLACYNETSVHNLGGIDTNAPYSGPDSNYTVLIESGSTSSEEFGSWIEDLYHQNKISKYCIWDRPGQGFSDSAPNALSIESTVDLLIEALKNQNVTGPFVVVSHGIGGLYSRVFASKKPESVKSLILVDSWHEDMLIGRTSDYYSAKVNDRNISLTPLSHWNGFKYWLQGIVSPLAIEFQLGWIFEHITSIQRIYGSSMLHQGKYLRSKLQQTLTASRSYKDILDCNEITSKKLKTMVISSGLMIEKNSQWGVWQRLISRDVGSCLAWEIIDGVKHEIWKNNKGKEKLQVLVLNFLDDYYYN